MHQADKNIHLAVGDQMLYNKLKKYKESPNSKDNFNFLKEEIEFLQNLGYLFIFYLMPNIPCTGMSLYIYTTHIHTHTYT